MTITNTLDIIYNDFIIDKQSNKNTQESSQKFGSYLKESLLESLPTSLTKTTPNINQEANGGNNLSIEEENKIEEMFLDMLLKDALPKTKESENYHNFIVSAYSETLAKNIDLNMNFIL